MGVPIFGGVSCVPHLWPIACLLGSKMVLVIGTLRGKPHVVLKFGVALSLGPVCMFFLGVGGVMRLKWPHESFILKWSTRNEYMMLSKEMNMYIQPKCRNHGAQQ